MVENKGCKGHWLGLLGGGWGLALVQISALLDALLPRYGACKSASSREGVKYYIMVVACCSNMGCGEKREKAELCQKTCYNCTTMIITNSHVEKKCPQN
jgi:hypothetical protein